MSGKKLVCPINTSGESAVNDVIDEDEKVISVTNQLQNVVVDNKHRSKPVAHVRPIVTDVSNHLVPNNTNQSNSQLSPSLGHKNSSEQIKTPTLSNRAILTATKAKKCRFYRNGDRFFKGVCVAISSERYRTLDSIAEEVTRALLGTGCVFLPSGVRILYALLDGRKITSPDELKDGEDYVCAGPGETFRKVDYGQRDPSAPPWRSGGGKKQAIFSNPPQSSVDSPTVISEKCVPPKLVLFVRNGTRPRRVVRVLLNKRNSPSFDGALSHITDCVKLDSGAVRKIFTLDGKQVLSLQELFTKNAVFLVYGSERHNRDDFELDLDEYRSLQTLSKATGRRGLAMTSSAISKPSRKMCGSEEHLSHSGRHSPALRSPAPRYKSHHLPKPKMPVKTKKPAGPVSATPLVPTSSEAGDYSSELPEAVSKEYDVGRVIGDGNFAVVRECVHRKSGQQFALKIIEKERCRGKVHMIESEVAILRRVNHPNIVHLYAEFDYTKQLFLVMELVKGGDLFDAIAAANKFNERDAATLTRHLTSALSYLHQRRIVHRDIKPENLLVDIDTSGNRILKLGDFGLAQEVTVPLYMVCGTPTYVAPEILAESGYGLKVDIWAAGVILYILLCGFPPFVSPTNDQEELFDLILSGIFEFPSPYWDDVSDSARELVASMLQVDQDLRFSAEDVLDHPWLSECYSDDEASLQLYHKLGVHFEPPDNSSGSNHQMISSVEGRQVDEAVASIFHTVLFHRSLGKFRYKEEGSYSVGTIGYEDVDCDFIDFTYVCCASEILDRTLKREISGFSEALRSYDGPQSGQISLEFFQKKKTRWFLQSECIPWEVWTVRLELTKLNNEHERQIRRETVGDLLTEKIMYIAEVMNRHEYVPKMPNQSELDLIFDTTFPDVQPYLFKIAFSTSGPSNTSVGSTMKKIIKETLSL